MRFLKNSALLLLGSYVATTMANSPFCPTSGRRAIYLSYTGLNYNNFTQTVMAASDAGYNVLIMSFYVVTSHAPFDSTTLWGQLGAGGQQAALNYVHNAGGCVLLSVGGATDVPYAMDPNAVAAEVSNYVNANNYDGVDYDLENFQPGMVYNGINVVPWLTTLNTATRNAIGAGKTITHAPQAPYFGVIGGNDWTGPTGGYSTIEQQTSIDWYNMQFYNQGPSCYVDYNGLYVSSGASCPTFPHTSVNEIVAQSKMSVSKIVIGKPVTPADGGSGWLDAGAFGNLLRQGLSNGINHGGYMGWKWEAEAQVWPKSVGTVGNGGGGVTPAPTVGGGTNPTPAPTVATPAPTVSGGTCSALWGQCGGKFWNGATCCAGGSKCSAQSEWYAQCIPAAL
jgi:chitinase